MLCTDNVFYRKNVGRTFGENHAKKYGEKMEDQETPDSPVQRFARLEFILVAATNHTLFLPC